MIRRFLFAAVAVLGSIHAHAPVHADEVIGDVSPAELKEKLTSWGYEVFVHEDEADRPQLLVTKVSDDAAPERQGMAIKMLDCLPEDRAFYERRCPSFQFRAFLTPGFPIKDKVYADWNREFGHTRAFIKEGHPRLAWDVGLTGGVTWAYIRNAVSVWETELTAYIDHLDASVLD